MEIPENYVPRSARVVRSVRVDEFLWNVFLQEVRKNKDSTCGVIELFCMLYLKIAKAQRKMGTDPQDFLDLLQPKTRIPDIQNLHLHREVQKPKRVEKVDAGSPLWQDHGGLFSCYKCKRISKILVFYHTAPDQAHRYYCCGYHVKVFRRMKTGNPYPGIGFRDLYK